MFLYLNGVLYNTNTFDLIDAVEVPIPSNPKEEQSSDKPTHRYFVRGILDASDKKLPFIYMLECNSLEDARQVVNEIYMQLSDEGEGITLTLR